MSFVPVKGKPGVLLDTETNKTYRLGAPRERGPYPGELDGPYSVEARRNLYQRMVVDGPANGFDDHHATLVMRYEATIDELIVRGTK